VCLFVRRIGRTIYTYLEPFYRLITPLNHEQTKILRMKMVKNWHLMGEITLATRPGFEHRALSWFLAKIRPLNLPPSLVRSLKKTLMDACTDLIHGDPADPHKPASMSIRVLLSEPRLEPAGVDDNWGFFNVEWVYDGSDRADSTRQISEFYLYLNHPSQPDQT